MGLECQIFLQDSKEGVYRPGETVVGALNYTINKPKKYLSIDVSFVGKGRCKWSESDSDEETTIGSCLDSDNEKITYSNEEEYISKNINLFSLGDGEGVVLSGTFEYPFDFLLPDDLPTSLKNPTCTIEYKVIATFVKEKNSKIKTFEEEVTVYGYVHPCSPEPQVFGLLKDFSSPTTVNNFTVKAEIDRTFVTPGENFTLTFAVENNSDVPIVIEAELIKYFTYVAAGGQTTKIQTEPMDTTRNYTPAIKEKSETQLTLIVPTLPSLYSIQHSKILIGDYQVRVIAKVPLSHIIAAVEVPVVIGERKVIHDVVTQDNQGDPPSYSE